MYGRADPCWPRLPRLSSAVITHEPPSAGLHPVVFGDVDSGRLLLRCQEIAVSTFPGTIGVGRRCPMLHDQRRGVRMWSRVRMQGPPRCLLSMPRLLDGGYALLPRRMKASQRRTPRLADRHYHRGVDPGRGLHRRLRLVLLPAPRQERGAQVIGALIGCRPRASVFSPYYGGAGHHTG